MSTLRVNNITARTGTGNIQVVGGKLVSPGSVLQVVQNLNRGFAGSTKTTLLSTTSTTFANILTASITTTAANSRMLVFAGTAAYNGAAQRGSTRLLRGATEIDANQYSAYDGGNIFTQYQHNVLDSPSVAAGTPITYSFQGRSYTGAVVNFGYGDGSGGPAAFVTIMEIAQ